MLRERKSGTAFESVFCATVLQLRDDVKDSPEPFTFTPPSYRLFSEVHFNVLSFSHPFFMSDSLYSSL
jgi:hypothetical protein